MRKDFSDELRTTDPVVQEPGLSEMEVLSLRRSIVAAAAAAHDTRRLPWRVGVAAALAFTVVAGVFIARVFAPVRRESAPPEATEQRQLQFETPGGTRVIWVLNSKLDLPEDRHQ